LGRDLFPFPLLGDPSQKAFGMTLRVGFEGGLLHISIICHPEMPVCERCHFRSIREGVNQRKTVPNMPRGILRELLKNPQKPIDRTEK
jgi:hypothetical protein